ncbi:MAG: 50S ribosomal protein L21 [Alphaproteobacteria bacterium]|jgi:large subunit ribosomal protein L21|nr:50S ribosomal protein L21 [Alphaproteobacteria bacterium]
MYAVVRTAGKQYRVAAQDKIFVDMLVGQPGETVAFDDVLMLGGDDGVTVGSPTIAGARVEAEVVEHTRGPRLTVFKKRRRKNSRRKNGHRQDRTVLKVLQIVGAGSAASPEPEAAPSAPEADGGPAPQPGA